MVENRDNFLKFNQPAKGAKILNAFTFMNILWPLLPEMLVSIYLSKILDGAAFPLQNPE